MAKAGINTGTTPNDGNGDTLLSGAIKINQNFTEIYNILGTGTSLNTIGIGGTVISINSNSFVGIGTTNSTSKLAVNGNTSLEDLNVSGVSTFAGITTVTGNTLFARQLNVSGVSTFAGITTVTGETLFAKQLNVSGVSTFSGITTVTGNTLFARQLNVSGISTFTSTTDSSSPTNGALTVSGGLGVARNLFVGYGLSVSGVSTFAGITTVTGNTLFARQLNVSGISTLGVTAVTNLTGQQLNVSGISTLGVTAVTNLTGQQLNISGISTLGVTAVTNLTGQQLNISGVSTFAGITTVTGNTLFAKQLNVSGVSTFINNVTFNNNISITASSSGDLLRLTQTGTGNALFVEDETTPNSTPFVINNAGSVGVGTTLPLAKLHVVGSILTSGLNASIGYSNGSGGSVTQSTSKTTSVTLNSSTGLIITSNSTINAGLTSSFTFTNSRIEVNDLLLVSHVSGGTLASYTIAAVPSNGSAIVYVRNNSSSNLAEALTLRFAIIKSTNS